METNEMAISQSDIELLKYFSQLNDAQRKSLQGFIKTFLGNTGQQINSNNKNLFNQLMEPSDEVYTAKSGSEGGTERKIKATERKEYEAEMIKRFTEMENGKVKGYTLDELEARTRRSYKNGKREK